MTTKELISEADLNSTGTPDFVKVLSGIPLEIVSAMDLFLSEFDYENNKTSNRAVALRILASMISALRRCSDDTERPKKSQNNRRKGK